METKRDSVQRDHIHVQIQQFCRNGQDHDSKNNISISLLASIKLHLLSIINKQLS